MRAAATMAPALLLLAGACNTDTPRGADGAIPDRAADLAAADAAPAADHGTADTASDADAAAEVPLPAGPGRFAGYGTHAGSYAIPAWGDYPVTVYFPTAAEDAAEPDRSGAPYPLVAFAHGWQGNKDANAWVGRHLARWGYVVALMSVPGATEFEVQRWSDGLIGAIDYALAASAAGQGGPLEGLVDPERIGIGGHSMGAEGSRLAAAADPRIDAVALLTACDGAPEADASIAAPVQLQAAEHDGMCPPAQSREHYDLLAAPKQLLVIAGGNHIGFIDAGIFYDAAKILVDNGTLPDKPATIPRDAQEQLSRSYLTAWFEVFLRGDPRLTPYLFGEHAQRDLSEGRLTELVFVEK